MHTLSDFEVLDEARIRFNTDLSVTPAQHVRFLLEKELKSMAAGSTAGFVQKPVPKEQLAHEQAWTHNKFLALVEMCWGRKPMDEWKEVTAFTRGLLLSARMWRLAQFHRDEFSMEWYCEIHFLMFLKFGYTLPMIDAPKPEEDLRVTRNTRQVRFAAEDDVLEIQASDAEEEAEPSTEPDLREIIERRREQQVAEPATPKIKGQCYNCRKRGHFISACTEPRKILMRSVIVLPAGSPRETADIPQGKPHYNRR